MPRSSTSARTMCLTASSEQPYTESSEALPLSVYGNSKLAGEYPGADHGPTAPGRSAPAVCTVSRARAEKAGGNFVETMLRKGRDGDAIRVVDDQVLTPTSTADLARQLSMLLSRTSRVCSTSPTKGPAPGMSLRRPSSKLPESMRGLAPTTSMSYKTPARRPSYSVLENGRLKDIGLNRMPHWRDALAEYLGRTGESPE